MASRRIEDLDIIIQPKALCFLDKCKQANIDLIVTCTYRSPEEQAALYSQGRDSLDVTNKLRKQLGMSLLAGRQKIVTNAKPGQSKHNIRLAFDVVLIDSTGKPIWDDKHPNWKRIGLIGKECGLKWAGDWTTFKEYPHFEI